MYDIGLILEINIQKKNQKNMYNPFLYYYIGIGYVITVVLIDFNFYCWYETQYF